MLKPAASVTSLDVSTPVSVNSTIIVDTIVTPAMAPVLADLPKDYVVLDEILHSLTSKSHLERDRALRRLEATLGDHDDAAIAHLKLSLLSLLANDDSWQTAHASVAACTIVVMHDCSARNPALLDAPDPAFVEALQVISPTLITHVEPRVREATSALIGALSHASPTSTYYILTPVLLSHAAKNFSLDERQRLEEAVRIASRDVNDAAAGAAKSGRSLLHETEGWRGLETTLLALAALVKASGPVAADSPDEHTFENILGCVDRARPHPNRFVREAGLKLLDACASSAASVSSRDVDARVSHVTKACLPSLREGLQDNWSQVRFVASVATRTILTSLSKRARQPFYDTLLPRMCLNRHYVAEGVRNYSQETWRTVLGTEGRHLLKRRLTGVLDFYVSQTTADNHAVREAACQSLGEAVLRLDSLVVALEAGRVVNALVNCFKDESWPVRDHACRALSDVVCAFPAQAEKEAVLEEVRSLFVRHLSDNIPSVRTNCARAFVRACAAYADEHPVMGFRNAAKIAAEQMLGIDSQREDAVADSKTSVTETSVKVHDTQFGAARHLATLKHSGTEAHDDAHTNQVMYSCGSLAPKLRRGGGCSDHGFVRPKEGWEVSEGGLLVWRELIAHNVRGRAHASALFDCAVKSGTTALSKNFRQKDKFIETVVGAFNDGLVARLPISAQAVPQIIRIANAAQNGQPDALRRAGRECRRLLAQNVGLRVVSEAEQELKTGDLAV